MFVFLLQWDELFLYTWLQTYYPVNILENIYGINNKQN